jgi:peroxiredoxin
MKHSKSLVYVCSALTAIAVFASASLVMAGPHKGGAHSTGDAHHASKAKLGEAAPDFTLKDSDGKEHHLSDYTKDGKIVVLEWFNPECPFIKLHFEKQTTMVDMYSKYKDKGVVVIAINSTNSGNPSFGKDADAKKKWKIDFPILIDADGKVGHIYGAKTTPHMFVIDKKGILRYDGAIDNDPKLDKSAKDKHNYVRAALDSLLAGKKVAEAETKPYGCGVKY